MTLKPWRDIITPNGEYARPTRLDEQLPVLGNVQAARRVAKTMIESKIVTKKNPIS